MNDLHTVNDDQPANDPGTFDALLTEEGQHLLASLRDFDPARELAVATRLRRDHPAPLVSAALEQARLRQRAVAKFGPEDAARMYFTPAGLEQATRADVAEYRAARLANGLGVRRLLDLCCGVGADALALARAGVAVLALDSSPLTCAVARANAEALGLAHLIEVRCADVTAAVTTGARRDGPDAGGAEETTVAGEFAEESAGEPEKLARKAGGSRDTGGPGDAGGSGVGERSGGAVRPVSVEEFDAVFVDPARRSTPGGAGARKGGGRGKGGGRIFDPEAYEPPLSWAVGVARAAGNAALKVAPGLPHEAVPEEAEAEWISHRGEVKEAVLWFGAALRPTAGGTGLHPAAGGAGGKAAVPGEPEAPEEPAAQEKPAAPEEAEGTGTAKGAVQGTAAPATGAEAAQRGWVLPPVSPGGRRATLLPAGGSLAGRGLPDPEAGPVRRYLYEPDGAVIRAGLVAEAAAEVDGELIDPTIAYITSDSLRLTPYATAYEITDVLPFQVKRLRALLRERGVGVLTVKKRGSAVEPEELRRKMRLSGPHSATVLLTRAAGAPVALLGHPAPGSP